MQYDPTGQQGLRMARYLSGISLFTRGIGILGVVGSVIGLLAAQGQRSSSDRLGFSLISLCVLLIAVVVWATGTFHGTVARLAPLLVRLDEKLDEARAEAAAERRRFALSTAPAPKQPEPAVTPEVLPVVPSPEGLSLDAHPDTEPTPAQSPPRTSSPEPEIQPEPKPEPKPEPVRTPCPSCGGLVHPEATRCVHCMKRIARS